MNKPLAALIAITSLAISGSLVAQPITSKSFVYKSADGVATVYLAQNILGKAYVKDVVLKNIKDNCQVSLKGGPLRGKLDTKISYNFAVFGWQAKADKINGVIANAAVTTYMPSSIEWNDINSQSCHIKAGNKKIKPS